MTLDWKEDFSQPVGAARGLGSARSGSQQWWQQRALSVALVPLTLWFVCSIIRLEGASQEAVAQWLSSPVSLGLILALIVGTFYHLQMGLQVVVEDYVHHNLIKTAVVLSLKGLCALLALICIVSALKIGL